MVATKIINWAADVCAVRIEIQDGWKSTFVKDLYRDFSVAQMEKLSEVIRLHDLPVLSTATGQELLDTTYDLNCWLERTSDIAPGMASTMYAALKLHAEGHWPRRINTQSQKLHHPRGLPDIEVCTLCNLSVVMDMALIRDIVCACDALPNLAMRVVEHIDDRDCTPQ